MPDDAAEKAPPNSKISDVQRAKIDSWVKEKLNGGLRPCPICMMNSWTLLPDFIGPPPWFEVSEQILLGNSQYPHFALVCTNCGNTNLINAVASGIIQPKPEG